LEVVVITQGVRQSNLVNVGTAEAPVLVPRAVVEADGSATEREWYGMVASGSVVVPSAILSKLIGGNKSGQKKS